MVLFAVDALSVRELDEADLDDLFALMGKELVRKYIPDRFESRDELRSVLLWLVSSYSRADPERLTYKICLGEKLIGWISTGPLPVDESRREIAYALDPEYWARGYASKVVRLFVAHLRESGIDSNLYAEIDETNVGSLRVVERAGFVRVGEFEDGKTGRRKWLYRLAGPSGDGSAPPLAATVSPESRSGVVRGINHLTLSVRSIDSAFAFYRDVLGLKPVMKSRISAYFRAGPTWVALVEEKDFQPSLNYSHICLDVGETDFSAVAARLRAAKVREWQEDYSEGESVYFLDDSGNKLEIHYSTLENRIAEVKQASEPGIEWFE